jgi:hypothetical protein
MHQVITHGMLPTSATKASVKEDVILALVIAWRTWITDKAGLRQKMILGPQPIAFELIL